MVKKNLVKKIFGYKNIWTKKNFGQKDLGQKIFLSKKKSGRVNPRGRRLDPHPTQKIVGLKLCWVVVSFVRWGRIQNFRPLGPLFLVEVEFVCGWCGWVGGVVWTAIIVSNPTLRWGYVKLRLAWGFDKFFWGGRKRNSAPDVLPMRSRYGVHAIS